MPRDDRSRRRAERLPYMVAAVVIVSVLFGAFTNSAGTPPLAWLLLAVVVGGLGFGFFRDFRQRQRAGPVRESVLSDSVVAEFRRVWVQLNPGTGKSASLMGGPFGVEVVVRTHSFEVGPAPPLRGSFRYYFEAQDVAMGTSRVRFSSLREKDCILLSGNYGGQDMRIALYAKGQMTQLWSALANAGVRPLTPPGFAT